MSRISETVEVLGGRRVLRTLPTNTLELHELLLVGLPHESVKTLESNFDLPQDALSRIIGVSTRTYQRNRNSEGRWDTVSSGRIWALGDVLNEATRVLGSQTKAVRWIRKTNVALGGKSPIDFMRTEAGTQEVMDVLGRMQYGIHS